MSTDGALLEITRKPAFQEEQRRERGRQALLSLQSEFEREQPRHEGTGLAVLDTLARRRRAEKILAEQDQAVRAGPASIQQRLENLRSTGDPSGQTSPGLEAGERNKRLLALEQDEAALDFFELNPAAAALAADDTSIGTELWKAVVSYGREVVEAKDAFTTQFRGGELGKEAGRLRFEIAQAQQLGYEAELIPQKKARLAEIEKEMSEQPQFEDTFDKYFSGSLGQMLGQMKEDFKVGAKYAAGGAVVGAGISAAGGGVGALPGAGFGFATGLTKEIAITEMGSMLGELEAEGYDTTDPDVVWAAKLYGYLSSAVEVASLGVAGRALSPVKSLARRQLKKLVGLPVGALAKKTALQQLRVRLVDIGKAVGAEASEEFIQTGLLSALAESMAEGDDWESVIDGTLERMPEAVDAALAAGGAMILGGGLARGASSIYARREIRQSQREQQFFEDYEQLAQKSTMIERSPELAGEFLDFTLNQSEQRDKIFVEREPLVQAMEANQIGLAEMEESFPGITERLARAEETGGRVDFSAKEFAKSMAGTPLFEGVRDHITSTPTGLTNSERMAELDESTEQAIEVQREATRVRFEIEDSADRVTQRIVQQLETTDSQFANPTEARRQAEVVRARILGFAETLSQGAGRLITPEEAFELAPLTVLSAEEAEAGRVNVAGEGAVLETGQTPEVASPDRPEFRALIEVEKEAKAALAPVREARDDAVEQFGSDSPEAEAAFDAYDEAQDRVREATRAIDDYVRARQPTTTLEQAAPTQRISTRLPTGKTDQDALADDRLLVGVDAVREFGRDQLAKHAATIRSYPNLRPRENESDEQTIKRFKKHVRENLVWLWNRVPFEVRERTRHWYVGANAIAQEWADDYGIEIQATAGMIAAMSPQKDWYMNVSLAERTLDVLTHDQDHVLTDDEIQGAINRNVKALESDRKKTATQREALAREFVRQMDRIRGLRLSEITDSAEAGMFVRARSQAIHDSSFRAVSPEGFFGDVVTNIDGSPQRIAWGSFQEIGRAVEIYRDSTREDQRCLEDQA